MRIIEEVLVSHEIKKIVEPRNATNINPAGSQIHSGEWNNENSEMNLLIPTDNKKLSTNALGDTATKIADMMESVIGTPIAPLGSGLHHNDRSNIEKRDSFINNNSLADAKQNITQPINSTVQDDDGVRAIASGGSSCKFCSLVFYFLSALN